MSYCVSVLQVGAETTANGLIGQICMRSLGGWVCEEMQRVGSAPCWQSYSGLAIAGARHTPHPCDASFVNIYRSENEPRCE